MAFPGAAGKKTARFQTGLDFIVVQHNSFYAQQYP